MGWITRPAVGANRALESGTFDLLLCPIVVIFAHRLQILRIEEQLWVPMVWHDVINNFSGRHNTML